MAFWDFLKKKELQEINELKQKLDRFSSITSIEEEEKKIAKNISIKHVELEELGKKYTDARKIYNSLKHEVTVYESTLDLAEFGVYEPIYDFDRSDDYREEQKRIIALQKELIQNDKAAICSTTWTINGSEAQGRAATNKFIKLILRAFNGEADALISKVKWNNINQIKERITKSWEILNKLGQSQSVVITIEFYNLKIKELTLEYEYKLKKQQEKEEQRALAEEQREEEKARREYEKAQKDAEKEEQYYNKVLEKVKLDYASNVGDPSELQAKIAHLEQELEEARLKKERALSMAQQTKRGYVYIISNIGSFGENVFKIGMTRRLEPMDRVRELGDASVPFKFDVHALIYSDEARTLEYELHKAFKDRALNLYNFKKEFFNVSLEEIEEKVKELGFEAEFNTLPEAEEYFETLAIKEKKLNASIPEILEINPFPESLDL